MSDGKKLALNHAEYRALKAVNQSGLKDFLESPELYYRKSVTREIPENPPTPSMIFGSNAERFVFHGRYPEDVVEIPAEKLNAQGHRKGAAWTEFAAQFPETMRLLKADEFAAEIGPLEFVRQQVLSHPRAGKLVSADKETSVVITWTDDATGLPCKAELDLVSSFGILCDFKTSESVLPSKFSRSILDFGYHIQKRWYQTAWRELTGDKLPFVFIVARNKPPYNVETFDLHERWDELADARIKYGLERMAKAYQSGEWRSPTWGDVHTLECPRWADNTLTFDL